MGCLDLSERAIETRMHHANLVEDSMRTASRECEFVPVLWSRMFIFWGWEGRVESLDASRKENAGAILRSRGPFVVYIYKRFAAAQARSATGHVRYNYQHLAHKALHCIRYERACRSACNAIVIFSPRAPDYVFTIHLTVKTLNFLKTSSMILERTIKDDDLYKHFRNFIVCISFIPV